MLMFCQIVMWKMYSGSYIGPFIACCRRIKVESVDNDV